MHSILLNHKVTDSNPSGDFWQTDFLSYVLLGSRSLVVIYVTQDQGSNILDTIYKCFDKF